MTGPDPAGIANLAAALAKVQGELPKLERDRTVEIVPNNKPSYSYSYVTLANLSDAVLPLLAKHELAFVTMPGLGEDGKMCLRYRLLHSSGESLGGEFPISGEGGIQVLGGRITYARRYCLAAMLGVAADEDDEGRLGNDDGPRSAQRAQRAPAQRRTKAAPAEGQPTAQRATRATNDAPPPLPGEGAPKWTPEQQGKIMATFTDIGVDTRDREARLGITSAILSHVMDKRIELKTSNQMTVEMAGKVIEALDEAATKEDPLIYLEVTYPPIETLAEMNES